MSSRVELMADMLSADARNPMKTFVLEAHPDGEPDSYLRDLAGPGRLDPTDDARLFKMHTDDGWFLVDQLDDRFWSFHTNMAQAPAHAYLKKHVSSRRDLDWIWLPSGHLRQMWPDSHNTHIRTKFNARKILAGASAFDDVSLQMSGRDANALLDHIYNQSNFRGAVSFDSVSMPLNDPDFGQINEAVNRMGRFAATGTSPEFHLQFVSGTIRRYEYLVTLCEGKVLNYTQFESSGGGGTMSGTPIGIEFSREIPDLEHFASVIFSSADPYRLWGSPHLTNDVIEVQAVDLHVGQTLSMDIGNTWMRVYLMAGGCGNTITRLVTNLQHHFDAALRFTEPELQEALEPDISESETT